MKKKLEKKSPLKDKPLRYAGQSLDESIEDTALNAIYWFLVGIFSVLMVIGDWVRYFYPQPPVKPWLVTVIVVFLVIWSVIKVFTLFKKAKRLQMARDGEKIVGEGLQELIRTCYGLS